LLKAVIFDMDGVIIDSEPMHARAAILALKKHNIDISMDYIQTFIGSTTLYMCQKMIDDFKINVTPEILLQNNNEMKAYLLEKEGYTVIPYIVDLMKNLYQNGLKLIIASSSSEDEIKKVMEALNIKQYLCGYISGTSVTHPKPAPDIFLEAAKHLDVSPEECIVIEDSCHGITAARAATMTCVGFVNPNSGNQDLSKADLLVEGFDEVDYIFLKQFYEYNNTLKTIITTDNVIIRELSIQDIPALYTIYQQPLIRKFLDDFNESLDLEIEKHKAYIKNVYHYYGYGLWGVYLKKDGCLIGRCGIEYKRFEDKDIYEIGYLLDSSYQGLGYAKEFVSKIIHYCFLELDIHCITAIIDKNNHRSIHLAKQVGMREIGECVRNSRNCFRYEIKYHD
jgi:HAD superfamily hydrolase (TIGR01509 family)